MAATSSSTSPTASLLVANPTQDARRRLRQGSARAGAGGSRRRRSGLWTCRLTPSPAAHEEVRDRLRVASATEPIDGRYDLITCIEVLEHMSPADAQAAIDNMCEASERVLFSSSPGDFDEPTHVNTHPTAAWAAWFAERGFFRRTDVNLEFLSAWAVLLRTRRSRHALRRGAPLRGLGGAALTSEVHEKTTALLSAHRAMSDLHDQINELESGIDGPIQDEMAALREELVQARPRQAARSA